MKSKFTELLKLKNCNRFTHSQIEFDLMISVLTDIIRELPRYYTGTTREQRNQLFTAIVGIIINRCATSTTSKDLFEFVDNLGVDISTRDTVRLSELSLIAIGDIDNLVKFFSVIKNILHKSVMHDVELDRDLATLCMLSNHFTRIIV